MAQDRIITEVQGVVCASNDRGVKLDGEAEWRNLSKWAEVAAIPGKGAVVVLGLDKAGYIREITTAEPQATGTVVPLPNAAQVSNLDTTVDRETRITRSACLNTAVNILCTGGVVSVDDVLQVAARLVSWVLR